MIDVLLSLLALAFAFTGACAAQVAYAGGCRREDADVVALISGTPLVAGGALLLFLRVA